MLTVGVLGAGQLGQMLALAGIPLGARFVFFDPASESCAACVGKHMSAGYHDQEALAQFLAQVDCVTFEFENVPLETLRTCAAKRPIFPGLSALECAQDRFKEKNTFNQLSIPTPRFHSVSHESDLEVAARDLGYPFVVKTSRLGYDGKGQQLIRLKGEIQRAWKQLEGGAPLIAEQFIKFQRELSIIGVRDQAKNIKFYPLTQNVHRNGILESSIAPALNISAELQNTAQKYLESILIKFDYVGVLALELFELNGELLANEMAPRVHNSGHWTQDGAATSQFENHLRAGMGLPLGSCESLGYSGMLNIIGKAPDAAQILAIPELALHLYGKNERAGRKLGHLNFCATTRERRDQLLNCAKSVLA